MDLDIRQNGASIEHTPGLNPLFVDAIPLSHGRKVVNALDAHVSLAAAWSMISFRAEFRSRHP